VSFSSDVRGLVLHEDNANVSADMKAIGLKVLKKYLILGCSVLCFKTAPYCNCAMIGTLSFLDRKIA